MTYEVIHLLQAFPNVILFRQLYSSFQDFDWRSASRGPSAIGEFILTPPVVALSSRFLAERGNCSAYRTGCVFVFVCRRCILCANA